MLIAERFIKFGEKIWTSSALFTDSNTRYH